MRVRWSLANIGSCRVIFYVKHFAYFLVRNCIILETDASQIFWHPSKRICKSRSETNVQIPESTSALTLTFPPPTVNMRWCFFIIWAYQLQFRQRYSSTGQKILLYCLHTESILISNIHAQQDVGRVVIPFSLFAVVSEWLVETLNRFF